MPRYTPSDRVTQQIDKIFCRHVPDADQVDRMDTLRRVAKELANQIVEFSPESREQSLALTHLEQAMFFANAAVVREPPGSMGGGK